MLCFRNVRRKIYNAAVLKSDLKPPTLVKSPNDVKVIIIGAGLAGLSAASHLIKHGFQRTLVLEASERCGGRVKSKHFGDAFCELGAKWVPIDTQQGSTYELLRHATGLQKKIQEKNNATYINPSGIKVNSNIHEMIDMLFRRICSGIDLKQKYKSGELHTLNNVQKYFESESEKIIKAIFTEEGEKIIAQEIFNSLFKEFGSIFGCCLDYINIKHVTNDLKNFPSPVYIPSGLDSIINYITDNIDDSHMRVGKPVGKIKWYGTLSPNEKPVGCMDGSQFNADHIICTLPLGVLKNFSSFIFKPMLPKEKIKAINNLGFGSPVKIYFEYGENIDKWFGSSVRPLWNDNVNKNNLDWIKQVVEITKPSSSHRVIEIIIGGAFYDKIEKLPDEEISEKVTKLMRCCLTNADLPYPISVLRSNWSSSACFLGGRPYFTTSSNSTDVTTLAAPLGEMPSLLFAGDATILNGFGTIDGARMSGIREAERIITYYNRMT